MAQLHVGRIEIAHLNFVVILLFSGDLPCRACEALQMRKREICARPIMLDETIIQLV